MFSRFSFDFQSKTIFPLSFHTGKSQNDNGTCVHKAIHQTNHHFHGFLPLHFPYLLPRLDATADEVPGHLGLVKVANAFMAAVDRRAAHREIHAWWAEARTGRGADWARWRATRRMKVAAAALHRPPTSSATTTRRARPCRTNSG